MRSILVIAAFLLCCAPADAYVLGGKKWPARTITYHAATPEFNTAIKAAVTAWNASGVKVRFAPTTAKRAQLRIRYSTAVSGDAEATVGYVRPHTATEKRLNGKPIIATGVPCGSRLRPPGMNPGRVTCHRVKVRAEMVIRKRAPAATDEPHEQRFMVSLVAHELGHVLGLEHEDDGCATMNTSLPGECVTPLEPNFRCRVLEADDVAGAIRRYGGTAASLGPEICGPPPPPTVAGVTGQFDGLTRELLLTWAHQPDYVRVHLVPGETCATAPTAFDQTSMFPGTGTLTFYSDSGPRCVMLWGEDRYGRFSAPATLWVEVPPPPVPEPR